ncbi:MAG TPA: response regulator transcription factor [Pyrinomonadaceae bacterium]|nr:response regulator transcription factor [Pyrinomonadaceae bacterium]
MLVADDNREMRNTVVHLIEDEFDVVGTVGDGQALVDAESRLSPNIGIVDISMPVMSGIEAAIEMRKRGSSMKIVFLTVNEDTDFVTAALETGASGYVIKRHMVTDLISALKATTAGGIFISPCCQIPVDKPVGN